MNFEPSLIFQEYLKNPVNNFALSEYTFSHSEGNSVCGDSIVVYVLFDQFDNIKNFSFEGDCSNITKASASFFADLCIGESINSVLNRNYDYLIQNGFEVSSKRKRAAVLPILATINGYYKYSGLDKRLEFDDLI